ncbi:MAG: DUF1844 domain-containing protein [Actinobacteria bacterium]|nr:DUF1844 domain-containing protein [Actinomycetota bacterium]
MTGNEKNGQEPEDKEKDEKKTSSSKLWTPYGDPRDKYAESGKPSENGQTQGEEEISEEELRKRIEEALEKVTVADIVLDFIISMASLAYQRMGIPKEVNEKFRDMEQARMAIDCIDALLGALKDKISDDTLEPLTGTLDNLKVNFVKES